MNETLYCRCGLPMEPKIRRRWPFGKYRFEASVKCHDCGLKCKCKSKSKDDALYGLSYTLALKKVYG